MESLLQPHPRNAADSEKARVSTESTLAEAAISATAVQRAQQIFLIARTVLPEHIELNSEDELAFHLASLNVGFTEAQWKRVIAGAGGCGDRAAAIAHELTVLGTRKITGERNPATKSSLAALLYGFDWKILQGPIAALDTSAVSTPPTAPAPAHLGVGEDLTDTSSVGTVPPDNQPTKLRPRGRPRKKEEPSAPHSSESKDNVSTMALTPVQEQFVTLARIVCPELVKSRISQAIFTRLSNVLGLGEVFLCSAFYDGVPLGESVFVAQDGLRSYLSTFVRTLPLNKREEIVDLADRIHWGILRGNDSRVLTAQPVSQLKPASVLDKPNSKPNPAPSRNSSSARTIFEALTRYGHDEDFEPFAGRGFVPTDAPAGSAEKIDVLRKRVEMGQPLWHEDDRIDYAGLTGVIKPRD